jgi:hypothetical protein
LTETCANEQPHLIAPVETTLATTQDEPMTNIIVNWDTTRGYSTKEILALCLCVL